MASLFDLSGKAALITGGNGGIGLGMAEGLAAAGAKVAIWGLNPEKNAAAEAKLRASAARSWFSAWTSAMKPPWSPALPRPSPPLAGWTSWPPTPASAAARRRSPNSPPNNGGG